MAQERRLYDTCCWSRHSKSGQVRLNGVDLVDKEPETRCGLGVGLVPEDAEFSDLSVFEIL